MTLKLKFSILITVLSINLGWSQEKLIKDLDNDKIKDTVYIDVEKAVIVCRLSSQKFRVVKSKPIELLNENASVRATKSGFKFSNNWMRAGLSCQFRYEPASAQVRLIGMDRYEFGNAANDGSGESSVNLLTNDYIANWNYFDLHENMLMKIPTIKQKMNLPKTYLANFSNAIFDAYQSKCFDLFDQHKKKAIKQKTGEPTNY